MAGSEHYRPSVYVETSIVSYRASRPSRDLVVAGHQELTRQWWDEKRYEYRLFISPLVVQEAGSGDSVAAASRIELLRELAMVRFDEQSEALGLQLIKELGLPLKARVDCFHLAIVMNSEIDYLLTWNCTHLANGEVIRRLGELCRREGLWLPVVCTPVEMLGRMEED